MKVIDSTIRESNIERLRERGVVLPKFSELADPSTIAPEIVRGLQRVDADSPHPLNLFRVHWYNDRRSGGFKPLPDHIVLPSSLTGIDAKIVVLLGDRFPMIRAHKVLAAYACLVPRIMSGEYDMQRQKAVWPSTGNYCRGGVAISRILGCRGVAILPEGMSRERFDWLEKWVSDPSDIVRTPGSESNVREIYEACNVLSRDSRNRIFNQFAEFANYIVHFHCTGTAIARVFESVGGELRAFVSASGSAGTLGAGDYLKHHYGSAIVAVEPVECPTLLQNGFGAHNIQGIGDKHVPLIHNVMNTDVVAEVSDRATDELNLLLHSPAGREYLATRRGVPAGMVEQLGSLGISSICNIIGAIKTAKYYRLTSSDVVATVATDGGEMYASEAKKTLAAFGGRFDAIDAATAFGRHILGAATDNMLELTTRDRERIFNLGYYTWVEQQGCSVEEFVARKDQSFWHALQELVPAWDEMIETANREARATVV
ncbi:MAG TPA: pyridoxal-phosphate dependent enzyme [Thermoanaerobaculia bacterium]|nr:pyridoxal-phosphate dependent enzyme [Thermoanaerobaculia bacterium]